MSLKIYTNFKEVKVRENFIYDVSVCMSVLGVKDCEFNRRVLKEIDMAEYISIEKFKSRFGDILKHYSLSTGSQSLIAVNQFPDKIINLSECGVNCGALLLELSNGAVYIPKSMLKHFNWGGCVNNNIDVICNGVHYTKLEEFIRYLEDMEEI